MRAHVPIKQQLKKLGPCPWPCSVCSAEGHHWYLDFGDDDIKADFCEINATCRHCGAKLTNIDPNDPLCPQV